MRRVSLSARVGGVAVAVCLWLPGQRSEAAEWEWELTPYAWLSDVSMDVRSDGVPVGGVEISFSDLLDKVDFVGQVHFEGQRGKRGFFLDATYIDLGKDQTIMGIKISPDFGLTFIELGGIYRPGAEEDVGLDLIFGVRYMELDQRIDVFLPIPPNPRVTLVSLTSTLYDIFVGFRYAAPLGQKGQFVFRGDIGGGDTELTTNALLGFGYQLGKTGKYTLFGGYRRMDIELLEHDDTGARVRTDVEMSGPIFGLGIGF